MSATTINTGAVHIYLAPIIEEYEMTALAHEVVSTRVDRMLNANYWGPDDSSAFKSDIAYEHRLLDEMKHLENRLSASLSVLVALFGETETSSTFAQLWSLVSPEKGGK